MILKINKLRQMKNRRMIIQQEKRQRPRFSNSFNLVTRNLIKNFSTLRIITKQKALVSREEVVIKDPKNRTKINHFLRSKAQG